jgi:hypothetical protein
VVITGSALVASAAGDGWIHDYQISGLDTRYLLPNVNHNCAALMTDTKRETDDLIPDPALRVIVEIGSADACPDDPEQYVGRMLQCGSRLFHDFNSPDSRKYHGFHEVILRSRQSRWGLLPVSLEKKYIVSHDIRCLPLSFYLSRYAS